MQTRNTRIHNGDKQTERSIGIERLREEQRQRTEKGRTDEEERVMEEQRKRTREQRKKQKKRTGKGRTEEQHSKANQ